MGKVLIKDGFYKGVPKDKWNKVQESIEELRKSENGIYGISPGANVKKFRGSNNLYTRRVSKSDRIIFTYTKYLLNYRGEYGEGIYLMEYINQHDKQDLRARELNHKISLNIDEKEQEEKQGKIYRIEPDSYEYEKYEEYFDLENNEVYVKDENELSRLFEKDEKSLEVYISNEQYKCIYDDCNKGKKATLLLGGAGSGKTILCLHKLNSYTSENSDYSEAAYFTYSMPLKIESEEQFNSISSSKYKVQSYTPNNKARFYTPDSFCLEFINSFGDKNIITKKQVKDFIWFQKNFDEIKKSIKLPSNINAIDVWTEIRGIIKGYMWKDWTRNFRIHQSEINEKSRNVLERYGYIKSYENDKRYIVCVDTSKTCKNSVIEKLNQDNEIENEKKEKIYKDLQKVYSISTSFEYPEGEKGNIDKRLLPLEEYLKLSNEISIYSKEERKSIYSICLAYQRYIDNEKFYDDNDLAGKCIVKLNESDKKPFKFLVVDEVQDLTELQIFLLYNLVADKNNIFFAGDVNQIINPTYFSPGRLKKLFKLHNKEIVTKYLYKNYRSEDKIVDLAEKMSNIRKNKIAKQKEKSEEPLSAMNKGAKLFYLAKSNNNLKQMVLEINENSNAATIVADENEKKKLEEIIGITSNNIYTVEEIKGLEFQYIFCYNLIGKYDSFWNDIFCDRAKKNSKYRYYFNIFYVSITRARKYLCLYDEKENEFFKSKMGDSFKLVKEYNFESLLFEELKNSKEDWEKKAQELERAEKFEKAIRAYEKANPDNKKNYNVIRCEAKKEAKEKNYFSAAEKMLKIDECEYAKEYAEVIGNTSMIILASIVAGNENYSELERKYGRDAINEFLSKYIVNEDYKKYVYKVIEDNLISAMRTNKENINNFITEMLEEKNE